MTDGSLYLRAAEIVGEVLDRAPDATDACARELCTGDDELLGEVLALLALHSNNDADDPFGDTAIEHKRRAHDEQFERLRATSHAGMPESIGRYRLIREIGRGGMGVVYECEQPSPRRRVAIKIIDALRSTSALEQRFAGEAELQGRLQHPGIAQIFEAGAADVAGARRPYFVMELVEGQPLRVYAEAKSLSLSERLMLVASIADGIAHAHHHDIVHRDLKHENILVTASGQPKVLDFGIARFTGEAATSAMTITSEGQILGTIGYMAPEQLDGTPGAIGPPADVYALGVMLYELVAGMPPHDLGGLSIGAALRTLDSQPPRPLRGVCPGVSRDIDTIVGTCLERDPARRYSDAGELANDIRRYLSDRPIRSRPPTAAYRATMFVRRHKTLVGGVAATMAVLVVGVVVATTLAIAERDARLAAQQQERLAQEREVVAIAGVVSGASALRDADRLWEARRQLSGVDPESRGWEWRHAALSLPWVIDIDNVRQMRERSAGRRLSTFSGTSSLVLEAVRPEISVWTLDLLTDELSEVPYQGGIRGAVRTAQPAGRAGVMTQDGRIGAVDLQTGAFDEWMPGTDFDLRDDGWSAVHSDPTNRILVIIESRTIRIFDTGHEVFRDEARSGPGSSMHWRRPQFDPNSRYVYLSEASSPGYVRTLDTSTWTEVASIRTPTNVPTALLSDDGASLLVDSGQAGMIRYTTPMLEPAEAVAAELGDIDGGTARVAGDLLILPNVRPGVVHLYDPVANETLRSIPLNNPGLNSGPFVSPDARLAAVPLPNENGIWVLDLTMPGDRSLTGLGGHASWVYQLAVSPDGSLLASAEPEGDILLWDLCADRLLAKLPRRSSSSDAVLAHNMDTPLVFTDDGRSLVFGELDDSLTPGVTTLDLDSGARSWVSTGSREATLDAAAAMLPAGAPAQLYHHAALLASGKIVQSHSREGLGREVIVRDPNDPEDRVMLEPGTYTRTGVAAHPSRPEYASGEYRLVRIRDADTNEILHEIADGSSSYVYGLAYSPDGSRLAMGTEDGRVLIMETRFYTRIAQFRIPPKADPSERNYVFNLAWTPDGSRLVTTGTNRLLIFESERPIVREHARAAWKRDLASARNGSDAPNAARRIVAIQRWATEGPAGRPAPAPTGR